MSHEVVEAFVKDMPRLRAKESLQRVLEFAVGSGSLKKEVSRRMVRKWEHAARGGQRQAIHRPRNEEEMRLRLAGMGIPMTVLPPQETRA